MPRGSTDEAFLIVDIVVETLLPDAHAYIRSLQQQLAEALGLGGATTPRTSERGAVSRRATRDGPAVRIRPR
ncbi:hypothetical protein GCM10009819_20500 [Agromyces tropicus]|uniref:Uncharacterized protein n=1 Tax=Agromyces tropicus TaxID=555371 RepID=A0ABP5G034_9MICO